MTAVKTLATMEELAETWSTTSSVNVKMGGKEKPATPVSSAFPKHNVCSVEAASTCCIALRKHGH